MYIDFENINDRARVWVYQANRNLSDAECSEITELGRSFVQSWTAHNNELKASMHVAHKRFIVLAVDESHSNASGCSIDNSVQFVREIEKKYSLDLFDRMKLAYWKDESITTINHSDLKNAVAESTISEDVLVFNNLVETVGQWRKAWQVPFNRSWMYSQIKSTVA